MQIMKKVKGVQVAEYPVEKLGYSIYVIEVERGANLKRSKELLAELGLVLVPYDKFFMAILNDKELLNAAKGKWAYLAGDGREESVVDKNDIYAINDKTGELETPKRGESVERLVHTLPGTRQLQVWVLSDDTAAFYGLRFYLYAQGRPGSGDVALVVFGIKYEDAVREAFVRLDESPVAKALRVEKGEMLEVTLPDGQKIQIDASAAKVVKRQ
jgi:hypothetical protein